MAVMTIGMGMGMGIIRDSMVYFLIYGFSTFSIHPYVLFCKCLFSVLFSVVCLMIEMNTMTR